MAVFLIFPLIIAREAGAPVTTSSSVSVVPGVRWVESLQAMATEVTPGHVQLAGSFVRLNVVPVGMLSVSESPAASLGPWLMTFSV